MTESCNARPLSIPVEVGGTTYDWHPGIGLDPAAVDSLHRFICKRATRLTGLGMTRGLSVADLIQEGRVGALEAARRFDATRGVAFITYAAFWIQQAQIQALRLVSVHIPTSVQADLLKSGGLPSVSSLDATLEDTDSLSLADVVSLDPPQEDQMLARQIRERVWEALGHLHGRYREVLIRRYGLHGAPETLVQIAATWGQSRTRVWQIQAIAERRLRSLLARGGTA